MRFYTDGSCLVNPGGPGGWSFVATNEVAISQNTVIRSGGACHTSALQMEVMAILEALRWADEQKVCDCEYEFHVDSHQALDYIERTWDMGKRDWKGCEGWANLSLLKQIFVLGMKLKPKFKYIVGHAGNPFNELADATARKMAIQFKDGQLISYKEAEAGDSVAARAEGSVYTKVYKVYAKLEGSGNILLKRAYQGSSGDLIAVSEQEFNQSLFIKIIW